MTSYLSENEAKNLQNGDIYAAQIPDFGMGYLENHLMHFLSFRIFFPFNSSKYDYPKLPTKKKCTLISSNLTYNSLT